MSIRDEWVESADLSDWLDGGRYFLTSDEVAALLASDECTDDQRSWYASVKPLRMTGARNLDELVKFFGNPLGGDK